MRDIGLRESVVLRRAGLPGDLLARSRADLSTEEYFRLWQAMEEEAGDTVLPLRIAEALSVDAFDPAVFAAYCSPDLNIALSRLATYKRLICPMALHVGVGKRKTTLKLEWLDAHVHPPASLIGFELVFFVQLARLATRTPIRPLEIRTPVPLEPRSPYEEFFSVSMKSGRHPTVVFQHEDATRPFLSANEEMWSTFEPGLKRRLSELDESATTIERVRSALLELLPSGDASIGAVAHELGTSNRTLQRRLQHEGATFQTVLDKTREELGRHYLTTTQLSGAEISFLLGYEDPSSFSRAFHSWTGHTPEALRTQ